MDRTSFDETDDYGIDRVTLVDSIPVSKLNVPVSSILKNGRVRRRLRWRPRRRNDVGPTDSTDSSGNGSVKGPEEIVRSTSSNMSVNSRSNMSYSSRNSHRSTHSFSSTQTMQRDNTEHSDIKARRFPLPRPNYPSTFDGVTTIGNESTMVHARIVNSETHLNSYGAASTVFAAADLESIDTSAQVDPDQDMPHPSSTPRKRAFPPLFRRKPPTVPLRMSTEWNSNSETPPMSPRTPRQTLSEPMFSPSNDDTSLQMPCFPPESQTAANKSESSPCESPSTPRTGSCVLPARHVLANESGEDLPTVEPDMEINERVDLRIPEQRQSEPPQDEKITETRETVHLSPFTSQQKRQLSQAVVFQRPHSLKWSNSDSAITSVSNTCVDFLLSADPEDIIIPVLETPELRFSMSESKSCPSGPAPSRTSSHLSAPIFSNNKPPLPRAPSASAASRPPLAPKSALPALPSAISSAAAVSCSSSSLSSVETDEAGLSPQKPALSASGPEASPEAIESILSEDSRSSSSVDAEDASFLDVEKNLQAIHDMGIDHLKHSEYVEALEVFEEILRGQLTRYGEEHYRVGTALHNIGIVHMKQGDYDEAAHVSHEAVRIRKLTLPADHPDIAVSLSQLGVALLECRKFKKAIAHFREALRIRRKCYGSKHLKIAKLLNNIGCALYELNELEIAKVAFEEALEVQRSTLREIPTQDLEEPPNQILLSIASTLSNIGSIKLFWGHTREASVDLEESLLIQQSVLGDDHPFAKRTEECLDWIEAQDGDPAVGGGDNSVGVIARDANTNAGKALCNSTAMPGDQPNEDLKKMLDLFNQNFLSFRTGFELACQGGEPLVHETHVAPDSSLETDVL